MERKFNPLKYSFNENGHPHGIDKYFWTEIKSADGKNPIDRFGFHVPSTISRKWPEVLKSRYGIEESVSYDSDISGLPLQVTREMIQKGYDEIYSGFASTESGPDKFEMVKLSEITPEMFLEFERIRIAVASSSVLPRVKMPKYKLTRWDEKVMEWYEGYGFLIESRDMDHLFLFSKPKGDFALKQEVVREYFFNIPEDIASSRDVAYYAGIFLSLAEEPNSNKAIWGFRRDLATDFPKEFPKPFVVEMSNLIRNLEQALK